MQFYCSSCVMKLVDFARNIFSNIINLKCFINIQLLMNFKIILLTNFFKYIYLSIIIILIII